MWKKRLALVAAVPTLFISVGIIISFAARDHSLANIWLVPIVLAPPISAFLGYYFAKKPLRFVVFYLAFIASIVPTIFGWLIFLYIPSFLVFSMVAILNIVDLITRFLPKRIDAQN